MIKPDEKIDAEGWRYFKPDRPIDSAEWPEGSTRWRPLPAGGTETEIFKRGAWRNPRHEAI